MQHNDLSASVFGLGQAIDRRPLTVTSDTQLKNTIAVMGKARASCVLPSLKLPLDSVLMNTARASCVLVMEELHLVGVFTESNAVQVIASGRSLEDKVADVVIPAVTLIQSDDCDSQDVFTALSLLRQQQICHLPVLDEQGQLLGIVTPESIYKVLQPADLLRSRYLAEVMTAPVIHAPETTSALHLAQLMAEHQVNCVVIVETSGDGMPVGMVTEHDIVQLQTLELDLSQTLAQSIMSPPLLCYSPSELVLVAPWEMLQQRAQSLVVSSRGDMRTARAEELLGIVTPTSFLQKLDLKEMSSAVERLHLSIDQFKAEKAELSQSDNPDFELPRQASLTKLQDQHEPNRLLNTIALRIRESLNLDEILNTAVVEVRQLLQTDRVLIYRFNPDLSGTVVVESVASGWHPTLGSTVKDTCFGQDYAQSYKEGRIQVTEDIYAAGLSQCHIDILTLFDIRANLVFPIVQGEHLWGLLCAYHCSGPRYWRQLEIDLLRQLATHIAIALQQAELYGQLQAELSERRRVEDALRQSEEETRKALEKEQELSELKSHFVTMTSHEFRTPLSTILYSAELVQRYSHKLSEKEKLQELLQIQATVKRMTQLLDDVLLIGKAEAGKLEFNPKPLDLVQFCSSLVKEMQPSAPYPPDTSNHAITFCTQGQCTNACMDEKLLRHILSNLLSNALKYSPQGGAINFDLICQQGEANFHVQDKGIGIPVADQSQLFNVFHRASNVNTILGTGLGLAIVKKSVDLHGGQVTSASEVGVGTTFKVVIPLYNQILKDDQNSRD